MMKISRRARRMERHHKQRKQPALNLVSLMDIFTILVFFLLVNSSSSQQLPKKNQLTLPSSITTNSPQETLTITITKKEVLVLGRSIGLIEDILNDKSEAIPALKEELTFQASKTLITEEALAEAQKGRSVTILGDENTSYQLISKILTSCQQSKYTKIAFAANQKAKKKG